MKIQKLFKMISRWIALALFGYAYFMADPVFAGEISAEYKCTSACSLCINFDGKKTVCSEKYQDDSDEFDKAKKLSRFVNEGLLVPSSDIKQGFSLNAFANKFFNCELMFKKAEQIKQAAENMCVRKTVKHETYEKRNLDEEPRENSRRERSSDRISEKEKDRDGDNDRRPASRAKEKERTTGTSLREQKKAAKREKVKRENVEELTPPPTESMDDLIKQMDE